MFESVDGRTHGRRLDWYTISSPGAFGSGELTSSPKGNDRSPENKQVFLNSSLVCKRFFNWSRAANSAVNG